MTEFQQFVVIRHGESQTNATNTFQAGNQYDSDPLTPLGAEHVARLAERLTTLPVDGHYSDEENLYDLWRRAEEIRRYLESRPEKLIVLVAHGGILKVWLANLMFTAVPGLDTLEHQLASYRGFTRLGWWDNTGVLSLKFSRDSGWLWLMTDIQHLEPDYFSFMPSAQRMAPSAPDAGAEYLGGEGAESLPTPS
jgi:broad specificity phosphatase PhoE